MLLIPSFISFIVPKLSFDLTAKGVTNVAQEISQLVTAISAITVQADENKNLSEDLSDEVAKFEKV